MTLRIGYDGCLVRPTGFGVDKCILQLAKSLCRKSDFELVLYARDLSLWSPDHGDSRASLMHPVTMPGYTRWRALRILWQQLVLPARAVSDRIDVFHATAYTMPIELRVPTVLTVFDCLAFERPEMCKAATRWYYRSMMPMSVHRANQLIVPSFVVREELLAHFRLSPDRITVIPPGVEARFRQKLSAAELDLVRERYQLPDRFVLFVGNLEPKKNVKRLIEAFTEASHAGLDGDLILVGGIGWGSNPRGHRTDSRVRFLGYVPEEDLPALYRLASEFAFPVLTEGFGLPVLEAMACGVTVVASPIPSAIESDPDAVILVDPFSVRSIAEGLMRAREDQELRQKFLARGPEVAARFSWEDAAEKTLKVYERASQNERRI